MRDRRGRKAKIKSTTLSVDNPPSLWTVDDVEKLHISSQTGFAWKDLISYTPSDHEENAILATIQDFRDRGNLTNNPLTINFWTEVKELSNVFLSAEREISGSSDEEEFDLIYGTLDIEEEEHQAMDLSAIKTDKRVRQVQFFDQVEQVSVESGTILEPPGQAALDPANRPMQRLKSSLSLAGSDSEDSSYSDDNALLDRVEEATTELKRSLLLCLTSNIANVNQISTYRSKYEVVVPNGTTEYRSTNDGRYVFYDKGTGEAGGAEIFGTEEKRRNTSHPEFEFWRNQLRRQVAGEMIATALQRRIWLRAPQVLATLQNQQPQLIYSSTEKNMVFYLVFLHRSVHLAVSCISDTYINHVKRGWLDDSDSFTVKWSRSYKLNHMSDLESAIRMIMTMIFQLQSSWKTGQHFWRPFTHEGVIRRL